MSEPFTLASIITFLKPLLPNIFGGLLALWRVKEDIKWGEKNTSGKIYTVLMTPIVFTTAVVFGYYFGGAILEFAGTTLFYKDGLPTITYAFVMMIATASSLRFMRIFMVRVEEIFNLIFDGVVNLLKDLFKVK